MHKDPHGYDIPRTPDQARARIALALERHNDLLVQQNEILERLVKIVAKTELHLGSLSNPRVQ